MHNYKVMPLRSGDYVVVSGNNQPGIRAVDFTDPADPQTVGWTDPVSLEPGPFLQRGLPDGRFLVDLLLEWLHVRKRYYPGFTGIRPE